MHGTRLRGDLTGLGNCAGSPKIYRLVELERIISIGEKNGVKTARKAAVEGPTKAFR